MKLTATTLIAALVASSAWFALAQDEAPARRGQGGAGGPGGGPGGMLARLPVYKALDANSDGVLSKEEIANASAALLTLDKDGNGELSAEEISPARRGGGADGAGGARGNRGGAEGGRAERPAPPEKKAE